MPQIPPAPGVPRKPGTLTEKASPVSADLVPIYDSESGNLLKKAQVGNLGGGAPTTAHYLTTQAESGLSAEVNLGALTTGILKHTVAAGVSTPATAAAGTDYVAPGGALGTPSSGTLTNCSGLPATGVSLDSVTATTGGLAQYDVIYQKSDTTAGKAKADAITTMYAVGFAAAAISQGASGNYYGPGRVVTNGAWSFTVGQPVYVSAGTAGAVTQTPLSPNQFSQVVGIALSATSLLVVIGDVVAVGPRVLAQDNDDNGMDSGNTNYNSDNAEEMIWTGLQQATAFGQMGGTPVHGQKLIHRIKNNGTGWILTYNGTYFRDACSRMTVSGSDWAFTTTANKVTYVGMIYNGTESIWDIIAVSQQP